MIAMLAAGALHGLVLVADARSCAVAMGDAKARVLVERCLRVSPATHPPCNVSNPCDLIIGEIARGCGLLEESKPDFCAAYPPQP
jgi:hypothetical protein